MFTNEEKVMEEKAIDMIDGAFKMGEDMMKMLDGYCTAKQSEVILDTLTKLHDMKRLSDDTYAKSLLSIIDQNGFKLVL